MIYIIRVIKGAVVASRGGRARVGGRGRGGERHGVVECCSWIAGGGCGRSLGGGWHGDKYVMTMRSGGMQRGRRVKRVVQGNPKLGMT